MHAPYRIARTFGMSAILILGGLVACIVAQELPSPQIPMASTGFAFNPQEVADAMAELYRLLADMGHVDHDMIHYAPHTDPPVNLTLAQSLHLEPQVIELLQLLPYPFLKDNPFGTQIHILFESKAAVYIDDRDLKYARDPLMYDFEEPSTEGPGILYPWEISLTFCMENGVNWLLDTRKGTIQNFPASRNTPLRDFQPGDDGYYVTDPPVPAAEAIRELIRKYRELDCQIPMCDQIVLGRHVNSLHGEGMFEEIRRNMIEEYGWPDNFRREAWREESREMVRAMGVGLY